MGLVCVLILVCLWSNRVASALGKVLMTGGYLIMERPNVGIVLSTSARFYAIVKPLYDELKPDSCMWVRCIVSHKLLIISDLIVELNVYIPSFYILN